MSPSDLPVALRRYIDSTTPLRFSDSNLQNLLEREMAKVPEGHKRATFRVDLDGAYLIGIKRIDGEEVDVDLRVAAGIEWETRKLEASFELVLSQ